MNELSIYLSSSSSWKGTENYGLGTLHVSEREKRKKCGASRRDEVGDQGAAGVAASKSCLVTSTAPIFEQHIIATKSFSIQALFIPHNKSLK